MLMPLLADLPVEPNVIIVLAMVIIGAVKALLEKAQKGRAEEAQHQEHQEHFEDNEAYDPYQEYEAELERQRAQMDISLPPEMPKKASPPPMPATSKPTPTPPPVSLAQPTRPTLTAAEKTALENLQLDSPRQRRAGAKSLSRNRLNTLLGSPTAARDALLLSEILGPPKALKGEE